MFSQSGTVQTTWESLLPSETSGGECQSLRTGHLRPAAQQVAVGLSSLRSPASLQEESGGCRVNVAVGRKTWRSLMSDVKILEPMVSKWRRLHSLGSHLSLSGPLKVVWL